MASSSSPPYDEAALSAAICTLLPVAYSFELPKTISQILQFRPRLVALQLPEGLAVFACTLGDIITRFTGAQIVILGDVTYGACCVDDYTARALGAEMLVHYGHSCLVPVDQTSIRTLYVFVEIRISGAHLGATIRRNFPSSASAFRRRVVGGVQKEEEGRVEVALEEQQAEGKRTKIALVGTVQFIAALQGLKEELESEWREEEGKEVLLIEGGDSTASSSAAASSAADPLFDRGAYSPYIPQIRPLSPGEILGCTSPTLPADTDAVLYVGDGRFHLESVMIANPRIPAFRYDPYDAVFVREWYDHARMREGREKAVRSARVGAQKGLAGKDAAEEVKAEAATPTDGASTSTAAASTSTLAAPASSSSSTPSGWGVILGTLGRQGSTRVLDSLLSTLSSHLPPIPAVPILLSELSPAKLALFGAHLDAFVQTSCPRLSLDWGEAFHRPLLSPYEANVAMRTTRGWGRGRGLGMEDLRSSSSSSASPSPSPSGIDAASSTDADDTAEEQAGDYPMDFYADDSRGPWTPRHGLGRKKRAPGATSNRDLLRRAGAARAVAAAKAAAEKGAGTAEAGV